MCKNCRTSTSLSLSLVSVASRSRIPVLISIFAFFFTFCSACFDFFRFFCFGLFFENLLFFFRGQLQIFGLIIVLLIVVGLAQVFCSTSLCKTQPLLGSASRARHALYVENRMNDIVNITTGLCESLN